MSSGEKTQIIVALIGMFPPILGTIAGLLIAYWQVFKERPSISELIRNLLRPNPKTSRHGAAPDTWVRFVRMMFIGLGIGVLIAAGWVIINRQKLPSEVLLWSFDQGTQAWQPEKHDVKPEDAATAVSWSSAKTLQSEFDFSQVKPGDLSGDTEPRATYYIDPVDNPDWSAFRTLAFDVENQSDHDLKVIFTISNGSCWYEFGEYRPLPKHQKSSLRFDLKAEKYKTCKAPTSKDNPPAAFKAVWRFDIIFGTQERPWNQVKGSVLISNIKLTDRIPDTK